MSIQITTAYAELHCRSCFSFLEGVSTPEELVDRARVLGLRALALTDRGGLYGAVRFAKHARACGVEAIIGAELSFPDGERVVLLVEDARGYARLCTVISRAQLRGEKDGPRLLLGDFDGGTEGMIALAGCTHAAALRERFGERFFLEMRHHGTRADVRRVRAVLATGRSIGVPCVVTGDVRYARREDAPLADLTACIRAHRTLAQARERAATAPNAEAHLRSPHAMARIFEEIPEAITASCAIAERCTFRLDRFEAQFPDAIVAGEVPAESRLRELVAAGARERYGDPPPPGVAERLAHELRTIARAGLCGYFLVVWDIVRAARAMGILCQGRGSAANSAVCYVLGITAVDPLRMDLLFERFLSDGRCELPDIDIDIAHRDRERVLQYIYDRYGRDHAAMAAEVITYGRRSAVRDLARVWGADARGCRVIARELRAGAPPERAFAAVLPEGEARTAAAWAARIEGLPRHLGIHVGGMVLTREPIVRVAPIERARMAGRTVVQWDKDDLADVGLVKIDLLGLGMLGALQEAFRMHGGLTLEAVPPDDPETYAMIRRADTIGVFQIESRAQQAMLPRLHPASLYDLALQIAIIRPGPIQGGMVHPFLRRRMGREPVVYPHPRLQPILARTLGVPLFQEQGMRIAMELAGFSAAEADELRRAMGNKRSHARMRELRERLLAGLRRNGIERDDAERLYAMLAAFADYGFPEAHAAGFAILAYASAYLKYRYPAIFLASLLNAQPMGFYAPDVLVQDARRHGVTVRPVLVNASAYRTIVENDGAVRLGFHLVRGIGESRRLALERALEGGPFPDLTAFVRRTRLPLQALESLALAGAFACWFASRRRALWEVRGVWERERRGELGRMMDVEEPEVAFPALEPYEEAAFDVRETGIATDGHPLQYVRASLERRGVVPAAGLSRLPHGARCRIAGLVVVRQRPATAKGVTFLTLDDETGLVQAIVHPRLFEREQRTICLSAGLVIEGRVERDGEAISVVAERIAALDSVRLDAERSHDFR